MKKLLIVVSLFLVVLTIAAQTTNLRVSSKFSVGSGVDITGIYGTSTTIDFTSTAAQTSNESNVTLAGAETGNTCLVSSTSLTSNASLSCYVSATSTVKVRFNNYSSVTKDPASDTYKIIVIKQ